MRPNITLISTAVNAAKALTAAGQEFEMENCTLTTHPPPVIIILYIMQAMQIPPGILQGGDGCADNDTTPHIAMAH
jgi:hypothetical protein